MMPHYYINNLGGASKVNMLVGFAPSNYGTNLDGVVSLLADFGELGVATALLSVTCTACVEQIQGSSFLTSLNQCPQDRSDHISIPYHSNALQGMINVLGPDSVGFQPTCASVGPIIGNV